MNAILPSATVVLKIAENPGGKQKCAICGKDFKLERVFATINPFGFVCYDCPVSGVEGMKAKAQEYVDHLVRHAEGLREKIGLLDNMHLPTEAELIAGAKKMIEEYDNPDPNQDDDGFASSVEGEQTPF